MIRHSEMAHLEELAIIAVVTFGFRFQFPIGYGVLFQAGLWDGLDRAVSGKPNLKAVSINVRYNEARFQHIATRPAASLAQCAQLVETNCTRLSQSAVRFSTLR